MLFVGLAIYVLFRTPIYALSWMDPELIGKLSLNIDFSVNKSIVYFIKYCLPDMLWYYSLLMSQTFFLKDNASRENILLFYFAASAPFVMEILQFIEIVPGTFDVADILVYIFTLITFKLCQRKNVLFS